MKKRSLSILAAVALLLTMLPVALFSATAAAPQTADALVEGMSRLTLQDFKNFTIKQGETVHKYCWSSYNNYNDGDGVDLQIDAAGKGLYVTNEKNKKGEAEYWIYALNKTAFVEGEYLAVTLKKNSVKTSFQAAFALGTNAFGFAVSDGAEVYYDTGDGALKTAATTGTVGLRTYTVGSGEAVTVYLPLSGFVNKDNTAQSMTAADLGDVQNLQIIFADLGNKNDADVANADAVSLRDVSLYLKKGLKTADELTKNMPKSVLQDFKNFTIKQGETVHRWPYSPHNNYNDEQGVELLVDAAGKGLYVANDKNKKGEAAFWVYIKEKSQFPAGQYLAVTLKKNSVKSSFEAALALGTSGFGFTVPAATDVYYDNGSGTLKIAAPVGDTDSRTYRTGTADTVTVYLPVDKFVRSDNASVGIAQTDLSDIQNLQLIFSDLGNKNDADVANEDAVSLREIALYTAAPAGPDESDWRPTGTKVLVQDFADGDGALNARRYKSQYAENPVSMEVKNGALVVDKTTVENQSADFFLLDIDKRNWTGAEYLAMTCEVLEDPDTNTNPYRTGLYLSFGGMIGGMPYFINDGATAAAGSRYWSKDGKYYEMTAKTGVAFHYPDAYAGLAKGDTFTAYVRIADLQYQWGEHAPITAAQLAYLDGVSMILPRNKDGNAMLAVQEIALYGENIQPEPGDEITLPAERVTLQDFKNVDTDKLLHWEEERDWKPVVENNELYLKGESGYFNLMVTDLMARNMEGMEYIAVTIRYKKATSLQIGLGLLFGGMSYGTGDNNGGQKSYYVDDGQRIREAKTPDVEMGNWVGPIVPAPISGDIVTLYLPLDQMRTYGSPIDKSLLTGVYLSSGWARSEGWIDESVENPPYLWALEDAFSVLKIEAVGSGFVREEKEVSVPADSKTLTDFTQQKDDLNYELDNAEAAVEPVVRDGRLWFDDLMGRFAPDTYVIDTTNEKLSTYNFNGATYLAVNLSGQTERDTSYVTMALEDANLRQFDFAGERIYVVAEDGKVYSVSYDGRAGINHQFYGKNVTALFPLEDFELSIYYFGNDYSPLDLSKMGSVRLGLYAGTRYSPVGLQSLALVGTAGNGNTGGSDGTNGGNNGGTAPPMGVGLKVALPLLLAGAAFVGVCFSRKRRKAL